MRTIWSKLVGVLLFVGFASLASQAALAQAPDHSASAKTAEEEAIPEAKTTGLDKNEVVLWILDSSLEAKETQAFRAGIHDALAGEAGRHLLSQESFKEFVAEQTRPLPRCFRGIEPCVSPKSLAFTALGISQVIRVKLGKKTDGLSAKYDLVDARGVVVRSSSALAKTPRDLAFATIRDVYDATGMLTVRTVPDDADLQIDGARVGTTPFLGRLPIGKHTYQIQLPAHTKITGEVEIRSGRSEVVEHTFDQLDGHLVVIDAPANGRVFVNGEYKGNVNERIALAPGTYTIEVKAKGYDTLRDTATVEPGLEAKRSAPMRPQESFFNTLGPENIILNNYMIRLGFEHVFQTTSFPNASTGGENSIAFATFPNEAQTAPSVGTIGQTMHANGLRLDFSYTFKNFGFVLLSLSYYGASPNEDIFVRGVNGTLEPAKLTSLQRFQVRPFQVFYRHVVENWAPFGELGMGADFQWLGVESDVFEPVTMTQATPFVALGFGTHYYFTPNYFAVARYSFQAYFDSAIGADHELFIGLGASFSNIFGFDVEPPEKL